ncbi:unnamed protein product, partial [marine sediment metagenome]
GVKKTMVWCKARLSDILALDEIPISDRPIVTKRRKLIIEGDTHA